MVERALAYPYFRPEYSFIFVADGDQGTVLEITSAPHNLLDGVSSTTVRVPWTDDSDSDEDAFYFGKGQEKEANACLDVLLGIASDDDAEAAQGGGASRAGAAGRNTAQPPLGGEMLLANYLRQNNMDLSFGDRVPVLAIGSDAAPEQLARKFIHAGLIADPLIPVLRARLHDFDVVHASCITAHGSVPATLWRSPGTVVDVFVAFLSPVQLSRMHETDGVTHPGGCDYRALGPCLLELQLPAAAEGDGGDGEEQGLMPEALRACFFYQGRAGCLAGLPFGPPIAAPAAAFPSSSSSSSSPPSAGGAPPCAPPGGGLPRLGALEPVALGEVSARKRTLRALDQRAVQAKLSGLPGMDIYDPAEIFAASAEGAAAGGRSTAAEGFVRGSLGAEVRRARSALLAERFSVRCNF
jgi:hypothetical protein